MIDENGGEDRLAPVIPLFGGKAPVASAVTRSAPDAGDALRKVVEREAPTAESAVGAPGGRLRALHSPSGDESGADEPDPGQAAEQASEALVRKLRARSLSVAEATTFLRGLQLASEQIAEIIDDFCDRRYLDDATLAGHLVTSGHERKGQGRIALARVLAQRGIPRDVADEALSELPDDDTERALEFARSKLRAMTRLDSETAKRRLSGQLARRGYPGSVVSAVVRTAMAEQSFGGSTSGVRFE